jgi:xanthine/uracil permease
MRLEHHRQGVLPLPHFFLRLGRYALFSLLLILFSLGIGTPGYHYWGQLNWLDSFHMASMILTGMGPVAEMTTNKAKLFSSLYALYSGIAFLSITAVFLAPIIHRLLHILHVEKDDNKSEE